MVNMRGLDIKTYRVDDRRTEITYMHAGHQWHQELPKLVFFLINLSLLIILLLIILLIYQSDRVALDSIKKGPTDY